MANAKPDIRAIFCAALDQKSPAEISLYLDAACGGDGDLRAQIEALLNSHRQAGKFLGGTASGEPATTDQQPLEKPGTQIGPYKLLQQIGEGGFGTVYMAEQQQPVRRMVALKIIKAGMDTREVIARFESERQALALMDHPNIAKVFDAGATESGRPFFVMELVKGVPITDFCDRNHMPSEQRLKLFIDVCHAIQHAHHKGVIHRDVKPSNVLVTLHDGVAVVKVIDFGVAKATSQRLTERTLFTAFGQMVGTPAYMSPEQAEMSGLDIDTRSDIYSLGVLLYELLTGTTPLDVQRLRSAGYAEMQRLIREEEAPRPSNRLSSLGDSATVLAGNRGTDRRQLVRLLAGDLDWIVMKALDKDRNRRYGTPGTFAEDVERYLHREAIIARPPSTTYQLRKFAQRNRAAVLTAAAILFALLAGTAVATWQAVRATRAEHDARIAAQAAAAKEAETKAVLEFVETKIIAAARPDGVLGGLGRKVTVREALDAALPFVAQNFKDQPLIEARLRTTLGASFGYLGDRKLAAKQYELAHELNTKHDPDRIESLRNMFRLTQTYFTMSRKAEAQKLCEEALIRMQARLGPNHRETLQTQVLQARIYSSLGRHDDALRLHEETLARQEAALGPDDRDTLYSMTYLANAVQALGRHEQALKYYEEALTRYHARFGDDHPDSLQPMNGLGNSYFRLGRHSEALRIREKALAMARDKLGPDHPDTLWAMRALAESHDVADRKADALRLREEALALERAIRGADHPATLASASRVADNYAALNLHEKAIELAQETVELLKAKLGPDDPGTLRSMGRLASIYDKAGRRADAKKLYATVVERQKVKLGSDHHDTLESMYVLSNLLSAEEQLKIRQEALVLVQAKLGPDHADTLEWLRRLAFSLERVNRGAEAVAVCDEYVRRAGDNPQNIARFQSVVYLRVNQFFKIGDPDGCRATAEMWEKLNATTFYHCYNAAGLRALTAAVIRKADMSEQASQRANAEADRAMDWLRKAVALGFKDVAHMEKPGGFDTLRDREDYKKLVADLKANAQQVAGKSGKP